MKQVYLFIIGDLNDAYCIEEVYRLYEDAEKELTSYFNDPEVMNHLNPDEEMGILEIDPEAEEKIKLIKKCYNNCPRDEVIGNSGYDVQQLCKECANSWVCSCYRK